MSTYDRLIGQELNDRYRVDSAIAEGGMGVVFRGTDNVTKGPVAIKFLKYSLDQGVFRRFEREAELISKFDHPNLVRLYDKGEFQDLPFLVLEFVEGIALGDILLQGRLSPTATIEMALAVSDGLRHAHSFGVIHRDLKPDNILVRETKAGYVAKLVDFGVARATTEHTSLTLAGSICGTPGYVSPEQLRGEELSTQSDLYSLGIVLFECLTGRRAYPGTDPMAILLRQNVEDVPTFESFPALTIPPDLSTLVFDLLERDRSKRVESAEEVVSRLQAIHKDSAFASTEKTHAIVIETEPPPDLRQSGVHSMPIRAGGGWNELLGGKPSAENAVIDPQLFDLNPNEIDVSFEFTSMARLTGEPDLPLNADVEPPLSVRGFGEEKPPVVARDFSNLELAGPIRAEETKGGKKKKAKKAAEELSPIWYVAIMIAIVVCVVSVFYWRAKVVSSQPPKDVIEAQMRPTPIEKPRWKANPEDDIPAEKR